MAQPPTTSGAHHCHVTKGQHCTRVFEIECTLRPSFRSIRGTLRNREQNLIFHDLARIYTNIRGDVCLDYLTNPRILRRWFYRLERAEFLTMEPSVPRIERNDGLKAYFSTRVFPLLGFHGSLPCREPHGCVQHLRDASPILGYTFLPCPFPLPTPQRPRGANPLR
eukprot:151703-Prorocentrum_minimum.AAC.2